MDRPLRIAQVAPPLERVPPEGYGGTERVMYELIVELVRRGHDVTTFASGDSDVPGRHVPTVPVALRPADFKDDPMGYFLTTMLAVLDSEHDFDIIHSHLEWSSVLLARAASVPVVATFHGRLDLPWSRELLASPSPASLVAISHSQASAHPDVDWTVVHNGLTLGGAPLERRRSEALCFVGRVAIEKGDRRGDRHRRGSPIGRCGSPRRSPRPAPSTSTTRRSSSRHSRPPGRRSSSLARSRARSATSSWRTATPR